MILIYPPPLNITLGQTIGITQGSFRDSITIGINIIVRPIFFAQKRTSEKGYQKIKHRVLMGVIIPSRI